MQALCGKAVETRTGLGFGLPPLPSRLGTPQPAAEPSAKSTGRATRDAGS